MAQRIDRFTGEHRFLSNFWLCTVRFEGVEYPSVEHAYQAAKTEVRSERAFIWAAQSPGEAKKRGRKVTLRSGWDESMRTFVMSFLLVQKFRDLDLAQSLLATGDAELVEGSTWGDTFWGVDLRTGKGENKLGKALMALRDQLCRGISRVRTRVVHCKREPYDVLIDRSTKWGNIFVIGKDGTRADVIEKHALWLPTQRHLMASLFELRGLTLGCWCPPKSCHGDTLALLADTLTCIDCVDNQTCPQAWDIFNVNGACLAEKWRR